MRINVDIERLVIDAGDLEGSRAASFGLALQTELTRLLAVHAAPALFTSGAALPVLRTEPVTQGAAASPAEQGTQIAQAVHGAIQR